MKDEAQVQPAADMATVLGLGKSALGKPRLTRRWIVAGVVVIVAGVVASQFLGGPAGVVYREGDVMKGSIVATVTATGKLQPVNEVDLGPEISGQIDKVLVDFNDRVTQGQILAMMDTDTLNAKVLQSRASLTAARARVEDAKATLNEVHMRAERMRELFKRGNASKQELDAAEAAETRGRAAVGSSEAQVAVSQATLSSDETTLAKAAIKSPINGVVLSRAVEPGQVVAATFQTPVLFKLAEDLTKMQLEVDVDEADIGFVQEGQPAAFAVDAFPDRQFPANLTQVRFAPKTVDNVVTYQAVLSVDNAALLLRPGMTATATIKTATRNDATLVPNAALRFRPAAAAAQGGMSFRFGGGPPSFMNAANAPPAVKAGSTQKVHVLTRGVPTPVDVKVGITNGLHTEILGGEIKPGDKVITGVDTPAP